MLTQIAPSASVNEYSTQCSQRNLLSDLPLASHTCRFLSFPVKGDIYAVVKTIKAQHLILYMCTYKPVDCPNNISFLSLTFTEQTGANLYKGAHDSYTSWISLKLLSFFCAILLPITLSNACCKCVKKQFECELGDSIK